MSFLVRGMEMPKSCKECFFLKYGNFKLFCALTFEDLTFSLPRSCPLVELPQHGRLIDADAFLRTIRPICDEDANAACTFETVKRLMVEHINNAPTIIQAEEGET